MKFEHLIQINDPAIVLLQPLSRQQLWNGLVARAYRPTEFVMGLLGCTVLSETPHPSGTVIERELDFGPFRVRDSILLDVGIKTVTRVAATAQYPASTLTILIEEPEQGALFLRFTYQWEQGEDATELDATTRGLREQAYLSADLDTVRRIRELAQDHNSPTLH